MPNSDIAFRRRYAKSRKAKPSRPVESAWYYINRNSIDVYAHFPGQVVTCRLTKRQLRAALNAMEWREAR